MRYQPNGRSVCVFTKRRKAWMTTSALTKAVAKPTASAVAAAVSISWRPFQRANRQAAYNVGIARKKENSVAASRLRPTTSPVTMVAPARHAGDQREYLAEADPDRLPQADVLRGAEAPAPLRAVEQQDQHPADD